MNSDMKLAIPMPDTELQTLSVLLVEDDPAHAKAIQLGLKKAFATMNLQIAGSLAAYCRIVAGRPPDIAILDLNLPDGYALDVLSSPPESGAFPILIMTSYGNEQVAVEALKRGALDYVVKSPEAFAGMPHTVERAWREWNLLRQHKQITENLRKSEENFHHSLDDSPLGIRIASAAGETIYANRTLLDFYGYESVEDLNRIPIHERYNPASYAEFKIRKKSREHGEFGPGEYEIAIVRKNGAVRQLRVFRKKIFWNGCQQYQVIYQDITERKQAEEHIREALREKEVLLQEIHHRVKNNLQIISGLLTMQAGQVPDKLLNKIFQESQNRIRSIALVHEKLYSSRNLAEIDFSQYLRTLCENLLVSYGIAAGRIGIFYKMEPLFFSIEKAIPLGLIVNELITNSLKHAFPAGRHGEICITLHECMGRSCPRSGKNPVSAGQNLVPTCKLTVADNGVGLAIGFKMAVQKSLGMQLIAILARQLQGKLKVSGRAGTRFSFTFPIIKGSKKEKYEEAYSCFGMEKEPAELIK